jgi:glycosyltransferase involved in cell wall biosynthesis
MADAGIRVLIIAENASDTFGGEAALPLRYFTSLHRRGMEVWLLTHARVRSELAAALPGQLDRMHFIEDSLLHRFLWWLGHPLEPRLRRVSTDFVLRLVTQRAQRKVARRLIKELRIDVVHQPTPVSPREPSLLMHLAAPVVIGPMNGETNYPSAFRGEESLATRLILRFASASATMLNQVFRGKIEASILLVANERSKAALPKTTKAEIHKLVDNGVDTNLWRRTDPQRSDGMICKFVFVGRLVRSKGVDLWLEACREVIRRGCPASMSVIGDGPERASLEEQARSLGMSAERAGQPGKVFFTGWQPQRRVAQLLVGQDCLVLPTLIEAGGAVLLEAMAMGLPVIATETGGPADYVDASCGVLVRPHSRADLIGGLADAMELLASDPELRLRMGAAGRRKVERSYDWDTKVDRMIYFYRRAANWQCGEKLSRSEVAQPSRCVM